MPSGYGSGGRLGYDLTHTWNSRYPVVRTLYTLTPPESGSYFFALGYGDGARLGNIVVDKAAAQAADVAIVTVSVPISEGSDRTSLDVNG
ncbi:hypothetical protein BC938DRAFT_470569 [Jimgerdemannia flammicorona]|uniref:Uncharacterized protein n=1 Tax=Jimgerdemannia flammicorona TaxID=994334 RepID=A0A433QA21_9FUNG|nr:hypothetical protein BC938DRAFT_470569 [Jimgerdemannia flammicorona]